ncbi:hypothetical protein BDR26DRAFT_883227, partial [Obelidium mucronatum]
MFLPNELVGQILLYLPLDETVARVAFASKTRLAVYLLDNLAFAKRHVDAQPSGVWSRVLPIPYQAMLMIPVFNSVLDPLRRDVQIGPSTQLKVAALLLNNPQYFDPTANENNFFIWVISCYNTELLDLVLNDPRIDPSCIHNYAIRKTVQQGHSATVQRLLLDPRESNHLIRILLADERVDPCDSNCLQLACEMNYPEAVGLLLTHEAVDPSADDNKLVIFASPKGLVKIVDILMRDPRVDPSAQGNSALLLAMGAGHYDVAERLL